MTKPHILLLFTGGTIAQVIDPTIHALVPAKTPKDILALAPELGDTFHIDYTFVDNIDSTNMQPTHWTKLAQEIYAKYTAYDGFVITHGTDTMSYTASALSFALTNLGKPIVLTGSQLPPDAKGTDAKRNLVDAFHVAAADLAEVVIVFGGKVLRGNRSSKRHESELDAFWSPVFPLLGKVDKKVTLSTHHKKRDNSLQPFLKAEYNSHTISIVVTPGLRPAYIDALIQGETQGIILEGYGPGNLPNKDNSLLPTIEKARSLNIPVIVVSQCSSGIAKMDVYQVGVTAEKAGAISGRDMLIEAATTKLMWVLSQTQTITEIEKMLQTNIAGEITNL